MRGLKHNILLQRLVVDVHKSFTIPREIRFQKRLKTHIHTSTASIETTQKIDAQEMGSSVHLNSVFPGDVTNSLMEMVAEDMGDRVHPNPWRNKNVVLSNNEDKKNSIFLKEQKTISHQVMLDGSTLNLSKSFISSIPED